jgi:hypothetical protein
MISLCKYSGNASVQNRLEKEDGGHSSKTKSTVDGAQAGGGTSLVATAALAGRLASGDGGVDKLALAEVLALDELLVLEGLVERASIGDVVSGLEVEGALDAVKLGGLDTEDN